MNLGRNRMNKKDNQRTRLTKLLFKNSLISLLQKKSIYQISVTELCDAAKLNRPTFYKYYDNVSDILTELEKETLQKGRQCIQEMADGSNNSHITPIYRLLCEIQENRKIYRLLLNNSMNGDFPFNMLQETITLLRDDVKSFATEENATSMK